MDDVQPILTALQDALLRKMGDEVELVFQYGSHVRSATHRYSDVDLSWVPAHETTWDSITVLVGDRLADLYPMHWSKLERMAEFRDVSASVLLHSRILYQRDEAAAQRFRGMAARLEALQQPDAQPEMVRRALEIFRTVGYDAYLLGLAAEAGHATACLQHTQAILRTVLHCLAVANQAVADTRKLEQVLALPRLLARHDADPQTARQHIAQIAAIIQPLHPLVVYLSPLDARAALDRVRAERPAEWADFVTWYLTGQAYGQTHPMAGWEGVVQFYEMRQKLEVELLAELPLPSLVIEHAGQEWDRSNAAIDRFIGAHLTA